MTHRTRLEIFKGFANSLSTVFDGSNENAKAGDVLDDVLSGTVSTTLSMWVKRGSTGGSQGIWAKWATVPDVDHRGIFIRFQTGNQLRCFLAGPGGIAGFFTTTNTYTDTANWIHILVIIDTAQAANIDKVDIYVDGVDQAGAYGNSAITTVNNSDGEITLASRSDDANFGNHNIDEVTIWDTIFTPTEVSELFNSGDPNNPLAHSQAANLVAYWRMGDGDTFPTITDNSTNSNDMTMNNMESGDFVADVP